MTDKSKPKDLADTDLEVSAGASFGIKPAIIDDDVAGFHPIPTGEGVMKTGERIMKPGIRVPKTGVRKINK